MKRVLLSLFLLMWLTSCARTQTVYVHPTIPSPLTEPCIPPIPSPNMTWGESVEYNEILLNLVEICNADKRAIKTMLEKQN